MTTTQTRDPSAIALALFQEGRISTVRDEVHARAALVRLCPDLDETTRRKVAASLVGWQRWGRM